MQHCQTLVAVLNEEIRILDRAREKSDDPGFSLSYSEKVGRILALRDVCEWARENRVEQCIVCETILEPISTYQTLRGTTVIRPLCQGCYEARLFE